LDFKFQEVMALVASVTHDQYITRYLQQENKKWPSFCEEDKQFVKENIDFDFELYFDWPIEIWIDTLRNLNNSITPHKFLFLLEPDSISQMKQMYVFTSLS
jgi:hypothetical protein